MVGSRRSKKNLGFNIEGGCVCVRESRRGVVGYVGEILIFRVLEGGGGYEERVGLLFPSRN